MASFTSARSVMSGWCRVADAPAYKRTEVDVGALLAKAIGAGQVVTDPDERRFYSQDVFAQGAVCAAVVRPQTVAHIAAVAGVAVATSHDLIARGGGMSYSGGYLPQRPASIIVDLTHLDQIIEINQTDMWVTVEAGCTWDSLNRALEPLGLRTPYWGPLSGLRSTVGGALSQNSVFFGSGVHGTAADTVIGLTIVLADGSIVTTGSGGGNGASAFFRHYGPDLTGLFTGDAGAFGIKVSATLRLIRRAPAQRYASFAFETREALVRAMHGVAREGLATECFAFDPFLQSVRMRRASLMSDVKTLAAVVTRQGSIGRGLLEGIRMAAAGRRFAQEVIWPMHAAVEDRTPAGAEDRLKSVRRIAVAAGGCETANTVPKAVHAAPFGPMNGMIGVDGERWVPVHGVLPNSRVTAFFASLDQFYDRHATEMSRHRVTSGYLITAVGPGATLVEPVFYWPDARMEIHDRSVDVAFMSRLPTHPEDAAARDFVTALRSEVIALFAETGAVHFQVGKTYPLRATRGPAGKGLLDALKAVLDPRGVINPGALGLADK